MPHTGWKLPWLTQMSTCSSGRSMTLRSTYVRSGGWTRPCRPSEGSLPTTWQSSPNLMITSPWRGKSWTLGTLMSSAGVRLLSARGHTREHPHYDRDGYLDPSSGPDWWRLRWKHCDPTPTPIGQRGSSRVGKKDAPSSWPCPSQTCWQGGCGPAGDHCEHCVLAPQHHGGGCRMARRACVGSGSGCWRPALPGCPRAPSASWAKAILVPMWFRWRRGPFFRPHGVVSDPKGVTSARVDCWEGPVRP